MDHPIDPRFLSMVIHDLRNPLNVIGLSLRLIDDELPADRPELAEDFGYLRENVAQIERMLAYLSTYGRQIAGETPLTAEPFDPRRLLEEVLERLTIRVAPDAVTPEIVVRDDCPDVVELDPYRARIALDHALSNALAAAREGVGSIRVVAGGGPSRWVTEVVLEEPPPDSIAPGPLTADGYERLIGNASERRGLDLAIAALITDHFGGTSRLAVEPGRYSSIVLDWPSRLTGAVAAPG